MSTPAQVTALGKTLVAALGRAFMEAASAHSSLGDIQQALLLLLGTAEEGGSQAAPAGAEGAALGGAGSAAPPEAGAGSAAAGEGGFSGQFAAALQGRQVATARERAAGAAQRDELDALRRLLAVGLQGMLRALSPAPPAAAAGGAGGAAEGQGLPQDLGEAGAAADGSAGSGGAGAAAPQGSGSGAALEPPQLTALFDALGPALSALVEGSRQGAAAQAAAAGPGGAAALAAARVAAQEQALVELLRTLLCSLPKPPTLFGQAAGIGGGGPSWVQAGLGLNDLLPLLAPALQRRTSNNTLTFVTGVQLGEVRAGLAGEVAVLRDGAAVASVALEARARGFHEAHLRLTEKLQHALRANALLQREVGVRVRVRPRSKVSKRVASVQGAWLWICEWGNRVCATGQLARGNPVAAACWPATQWQMTARRLRNFGGVGCAGGGGVRRAAGVEAAQLRGAVGACAGLQPWRPTRVWCPVGLTTRRPARQPARR